MSATTNSEMSNAAEEQGKPAGNSRRVIERLGEIDFDPGALRAKYNEERDKRIRPDGNDQYIEVKGDFAHFVDDPYVEPGFDRAPLTDEIDIVVIGGGFAGLLAGARFREAGLDSFRIIEAGGDFGGTWYWNRYPGAQCDIESYCYLPLLEELNYIPKEKYSYAPEIFEHSKRIAREFRLYDDVCFQTKVTDLSWDEASARWIVSTDRSDRMRARFVVVGTGPMSMPKLPAIKGIDEFQGHTFHTSRWDYRYTGGDHNGKLDRLSDKRVAVIGTGATAIQSIPYLGAHAQHLYVFQRTPSSVDVRGNTPTDMEWAKSLKPGWQQERRKNFNEIVHGKPFEEDLVHDGWTDLYRILADMFREVGDPSLTAEEASQIGEIADFKKMNALRARVDQVVKDPATAEKLKAWYRQFCKRPTFNDEYLPTFNRPNVTLVDTSETAGVQQITRTGVIANGVEYPVDCIVFATGFEIGTSLMRRSGFEIKGMNGISLSDYWADGIKTFHGFWTHGFPNCLVMGPTQKGLSVNFTSILDDQAKHIAYLIKEVKARGRFGQPSLAAETEWVATIRRLVVDNSAFFDACTPSYYNNEGHMAERGGGLTSEAYGKGANAFNALLKQWRDEGALEGIEIY